MLNTSMRITKLLTALAVACLCFYTASVQAQLTVSPATTQGQVEALVNSLKSSKGGVTISNVTWSAYGSAPGESGSAIGSFSTPVPILTEMKSGVVLSTGKIANIVGPNYLESAGSDLQRAGDSDVSRMIGGATRDAVIVEFDVIPAGEVLLLRYVFASEEYPEKVCAPINDAFGIFISGPGIVGKKNMAYLEDWETIPVGINSVNNGPGNAPGVNVANCLANYDGNYIDNPPSSASNSLLQYDGYTIVSVARAEVQPCQQYHIKIVLADGGDGLYDSGILLKAGSLEVDELSIWTEEDVHTICQNEALTLNGPEGYASYQWKKNGSSISGATQATYSATTSGTYTVEVKKQSCSAGILSSEFEVTYKSTIQPGIDVVGTNLCISPTGVTLTAKHSAGSYKWSPGNQTTRSITVTEPGTYSVEVEDNSCKATYDKIIVGNTMTIRTDTVGMVSCYDYKDGFIHISMIDKVSTFTYEWTKTSDPFKSVLEDLCCLKAGVYTVKVTDADGCVKTKTEEVTQPDDIIITAEQIENTGASVNATISGGTLPYTYSWTNESGAVVATTEDVESLPAGIYTLTVVDKHNCSKTTTVEVTGGCTASVTTVITPVSCISVADGAVVLTVTNLPGTITYSWQGPESFTSTTQNIAGVKAGEYTYTAVNEHQCKATGTITIGAPAFAASVAVTNPGCYDASTGSATVAVTGGKLPYTYQWQNASDVTISTDVATGAIIGAGNYKVLVTDSTGCVTRSNFTILQPDELTVSLVLTYVSCYGLTDGGIAATFEGGTPPYTYSWTGPSSYASTAAHISGLAAGSYTLVLTDSKNCTSQEGNSVSLTLTSPAQMIVSVTPEATQGQATASVSAGGISPFTYLWSDGQTTATATGLKNNAYSVTVTGQNGCSATTTHTPANACNIRIVTDQVSNMSCSEENNGSIGVSINGASSPVYSWTGPNGFTSSAEDIDHLSNGAYTLTVTDANSCKESKTFMIQKPLAITATLTETQISCHDLNNGSITAEVSGGTPGATPAPDFYQFSWKKDGSAFATTKNLTALSAGVYEATITDANGCSTVVSKTIVNPDALSVSAVKSDVTCYGNTDGKITVTHTGGTAPYTYTWIKQGGGFSATTKDVSSLTAGTYAVRVTDARGCFVQSSPILIKAPASAMTLTLNSKTNATCASGRDGTASITAASGHGTYTYNWTLFGNTIPATGTLEDQTTLKAGNYTVYATDAGGCVKSLEVEITAPTAPEIVLSGAQNICAGQSATLSSSQSGTAYKWLFNDQSSGVATTSTYTVNSVGQSGYYTLVVTKSDGCSDTTNALQVTVNAKPSAAITVSRTHFCQGDTVILSSINYPEATYSWKLGPTALTTPSPAHILKVTQAGTYTLDITTPLCAATQGTAVLTSHNPFSVSASVMHVTCNTPESGSITVASSGQYGTVSWDWAHIEGASNSASVSSLTDGYYKVTATDEAGCLVVKYITVLETDLNVQNTITNVSCAGATTGSIILNPTSTKSGSMGSCYAGTLVSPYICGDPSFVSLSGSSNVTIGAGQKYMVQSGDTYTGSITLNNGGILVVCGTISHTTAGQVITFNGGTLIINFGGHLLSSNSIIQNGGSMINYGELKAITFALAQSLECKNYGSMTASIGIGISYLAVFENYSTVIGGQLNTSGSSIVSGLPIQNYGTMQLSSITLAAGMTLNNYCTITSSSLKLDNASSILNNYSTITVSGTSESNGTITQQAGAKLETYNLKLNGTINGLGASCSLVKINNNTTINSGGSFTGKTGVCPAITIVNNNGTSAYGPEVTTNCSCAINSTPVTCSVAWSGPGIAGGTTGNTLSSLASGTYTASITCGDCSKSISYIVTEPPTLIANVDQIYKPACFGDANGGIDISVTGGTPKIAPSAPYTYAWTGPNGFTSTSQDINNAEAGAYKLIVKDKNNCTYTIDTVRITQAGLLTASVECSGGPSCAGASNGSAYANISGGTAPYTYTWTKQGNTTPLTQSTGRSISGLPAGTYELLVKDHNNCETTASVVVPEATNDCVTNCTLSLTLEKQDATCATSKDGWIYVSVSGASGAVQYDWAHIAGTDNPASPGYVLANTYSLKIKDDRGCVSQKEISVGNTYSTCETPVVCNLQAVVSSIDPTCPGSENGSVTISATGANGSITIDWMHISGTENSLSISELAAGVYRGTLSDEEGCATPVVVTLMGKSAPALYAAATVVCPQNPVTLVSSYAAGNTWSTGATTRQIVVTAPGTYTLTTLIPGCSEPAVNQVVVTQGNCSTASPVCDPPDEEEIEYVDHCAQDELEIAYSNAYERYFQYIEDLKEQFRNKYIETCLDAKETLTAEYGDNEHHYTLYYYDQAGNLVRTVPPKGVNPLSPTETAQAKADYEGKKRTVYTNHTLKSTYTYNSLNQLIAQNIPDHDPIELSSIDMAITGLDNSYTISAAHFPSSTGKGFVLAENSDDGKIFFTQDNGKTWSELSTVCTEDILDIEKINDNVLHAVGNKGTYIVSTDGGKRWILKETGLSADLIKLHYFSYSLPLTEGVLIDRQGKVYQTMDGGETWLEVTSTGNLYSLLTADGATLTDIHYTSNTEVYASAKNNTAGFLYKSIVGGYSWSKLQNIRSAGPVMTTSMPAPQVTVVTTSDNYLISSVDNGANWKIATNGGAAYGNEPMRFRSATQGIRYRTTASQILSTNDAGTTWTASQSNVQLMYADELPSLTVLAYKTDGTIYKSTNGGFNFALASANVPASGVVAMASSPSGNFIAVADNNGEIRFRPKSIDPSHSYAWQRIFYASVPATIKKMIIREDQNGTLLLSDGSVYRFVSNVMTGGSVAANPYYGNTGFTDLIAVNNTDNLLAFKADGSLIYSTDGGVNWSMGTSLPGTGIQPFMGLSATINAGKVIATIGDAGGNVYRNEDLLGAGTWQNAIGYLKPLPVTAISVNGDGIGIATTSGNSYLRTTTEGNQWTILPYGSAVTLSAGATFTEIAQAGINVWMGASDGKIYASGDDGQSWTANNTGASNAVILKIDANSAGRVFALNKTGGILYKNTSATSWTTISPNVVTDPLYDLVFASSDNNTVVVGGAGKVLLAENGSTLFANVTNSDAPVLYASTMTTSSEGYAAGKNGVVIKTKTGGQKWSELNSGTSKTLFALDFLDENKGLVAGDAVIRVTANGGADNFSAYSIGTTPSSLSGYTFRKATFLDASHIFLAGYQGGTGIVFTSADGGQNFAKQATTFSEPIYSMTFFNSVDGIMAGKSSSELYKISRSGTTYTFTTISISNTYMQGRKILNLAMASPKVWYVVGEDGLLLRTDDAGAHWMDLNNASISADLSFLNKRGDELAIGGTNGSLLYLNDERSRYTDKFWYDELGRLVASQNSKQNNYTPQKAYSYTLYDALGRITEVGEVLTEHSILEAINNIDASQVNYNKFSQVFLNKAGNVRREITRTYYDVQKFTVPSLTQSELRNRVASITYQSAAGTDELAYDYASHYSYDVHGNVGALVQDNAKLAREYASFAAQRYKKIEYSYDLISGNVLQVSYQKGLDDQFYHQYEYDADNRITNVYTSRDGKLYEQDAKYFYYRHGPLARAEIGNDKVQAMDYAYTIQGWIKGVNSTILNPANDQGKDGATSSGNRYIATDAAGYSLNYFAGDYKAVGSISSSNMFTASGLPSSISGVGNNLYNGNISSMATTIHKDQPGGGTLAVPQLTAYKYDQLNRIKQLKAYKDVNISSTNSWSNATNDNAYNESFTYDANGNIKALKRNNEAGVTIDELTYVYEDKTDPGNSYARNTNRLRAVKDIADETNIGDIRKGQESNNTILSNNNYDYDAIGNLKQDISEGIEKIEWNVYGKVSKVLRADTSSKDDLEFLYDAGGNRIAKIAKPAISKADASTWTTTYYVRDAQGNVLTTYQQVGTKYKPQEYTLYGSSRLGTRGADSTIVYLHQEAGVVNQVTPPAYEAGACDVEISNANALYSIKNGQRGVIPEGTTFSGKIIQEGGTLLVRGTYDVGVTAESTGNYTYLGGEILVTGTLQGYSIGDPGCTIYQNCDYNNSLAGFAIRLGVGSYNMTALQSLGLNAQNLRSVKVGAGYRLRINDGPNFDSPDEYVFTESNSCFLNPYYDASDNTVSVVVERITVGLVEANCAPTGGTVTSVLNNYGTVSLIKSNPGTGNKVNNYGLYKVQEIKLSGSAEFNNFGTVNNSFFEVTSSAAVVNQKPLSQLTTDVLTVYGTIAGDNQTFSTLTIGSTNVLATGSLTGLLKLCTGQLVNIGTVGSSVIQDCSFEIPGTVTKTTVKYELRSGLKQYEFSNHLGNVLSTISDRRIGVSLSGSPNLVDHYTAVILSSSDYYAFGSQMPGRGYKGNNDYKYGFNGKEDDKESGWQNYGMRMYDTRLGRFFSGDPLSPKYPWYTPYQFAGNKPIYAVDVDGAEEYGSIFSPKWYRGRTPLAIMTRDVNQRATEFAANHPRTLMFLSGAATTVSGLSSVIGGVGLLLTPEPTTATKWGGFGLITTGLPGIGFGTTIMIESFTASPQYVPGGLFEAIGYSIGKGYNIEDLQTTGMALDLSISLFAGGNPLKPTDANSAIGTLAAIYGASLSYDTYKSTLIKVFKTTTDNSPDGLIKTVRVTIIVDHAIQKGETLSSIAKQYNTTVDNLMEQNPGIKDQNKIKSGSKIRISSSEYESVQIGNSPSDLLPTNSDNRNTQSTEKVVGK